MAIDFEKYRRRRERMKRLELVYRKAQALFDAAQAGKPTEHVWNAMTKLKTAVALVDQLPPPPKSDEPDPAS